MTEFSPFLTLLRIIGDKDRSAILLYTAGIYKSRMIVNL